MPSLPELQETLTVKRDRLHSIMEEGGGQRNLDLSRITSLQGDNEYKASEIRRMHDEINAVAQEVDRLSLLSNLGQQNDQELKRLTEPVTNGLWHPSGGGSDGLRISDAKSLRRAIEIDANYRAFREGKTRTASLSLPAESFKTLITLSTVNRQNTRLDPVDMAMEERTVADLMAQGASDGNTFEYYEETTVTNNAATVGEGGTKPESALAWTLRTENIRKIATWIPATDESLRDVSWLESQIRSRLAFMVVREEEEQILSGDGTGTNLTGILNRSGIQTYALSAEPVPTAIYKGLQLVRGAAGSGFAEPTAVVMHPNDWTGIRTLTTTDGIYIWGSPSEDGADRIWGLPVRQTTAMTENTALVGAFRPHAQVVRREGITVTVSTEHSTYFIENKVAILAEERLGLAVFRPSAFATVTGI